MLKNHITVCIATYQRHQMLERLLRKLADQNTSELFSFSIVVIDNDSSGSAKPLVTKLKNNLFPDIVYDVEHVQSIAGARNHALRLAKGNYIAIIDDDELPPRDWLLNMYSTLNVFDVDGVLGPVKPYFETRPPKWLVKGKFCERPVIQTGTILHWHQTRTGNVLLKKKVFDDYNLRFDETFVTGGSDQAFFRMAMQHGYRFVACAEAPVYEVVLPHRLAKSYYIRRSLVNGYNARKYATGITCLFAPFKSGAALIAYLVALPFSTLFGIHRAMQCLEKGSFHLSRLFATFGIEILRKRNF